MSSDEIGKEHLDWYHKMVHYINQQSNNDFITAHQWTHNRFKVQSRNSFKRHLDSVKQMMQRNAMRQRQLQNLLASQRKMMEKQTEQSSSEWRRSLIKTLGTFKPPTVYERPKIFGQQRTEWGSSLPPGDLNPRQPKPFEAPEQFEPPGPMEQSPGWPGI